MKVYGDEFKALLAADVGPVEVDWVWPERMPVGRPSFIVGATGSGKTTLVALIVAKASNGDLDGTKHRVALMSQEDTEAGLLRVKLEAAGADLSRVFLRSPEDGWWKFPNDLDKLARFINIHKPRLMMLDSFQMFVPGYTKEDPANETMGALEEISNQTRCAFCFIHHFIKAGKDFFSAMSGNSAIRNRAGVICLFGAMDGRSDMGVHDHVPLSERVDEEDEPPEASRVLAWAKNNPGSGGKMPSSLAYHVEQVAVPGVSYPVDRAAFVGESPMTYQDVFSHGASAASTPVSRIETAEKFLVHYLIDGPKRSADLEQMAKLASIASRTLMRARKSLGIERFQTDRQWWVKLPSTFNEVPDSFPSDWDK